MKSDLETVLGRLVGVYETAKMLQNLLEGTIAIADNYQGNIDAATFERIEQQRERIVEILGPRSAASDQIAECLERLERKIVVDTEKSAS